MPEQERNNLTGAVVLGGERKLEGEKGEKKSDCGSRRRQSSSPVSMQYYRIWIYSCNSVLGVTSAIFTVFAAFVLADVRLSLLG